MKPFGTKHTVYIQTFTVEGDGDFPFDMLRYDFAWPDSQKEIPDLISYLGEKYKSPRQVTLKRVAFNGERPTDARWQSFGWKVIRVQDR